MASFNGLVRFEDGTIMHIEYNGTSDICIPKLRDSFEEVTKHWKSDDFNIPDDCKHDSEDVIIFDSVSYWTGKACRKCGYIIDKWNTYDADDQIFGVPEWVKIYCKEKGFIFYHESK